MVDVIAVDSNNAVVAGVPITFAADSGEIAVTSGTTAANGRASAVLTTASSSALRTITLTATAGSAQDSELVIVVAPSNDNPPQPRLGVLNPDGTFSSGVIGFGLAQVPAGGSTGMTIDVVDVANNNAVVTDTVDVTFTSRCIGADSSDVNPNPATSFSGVVSATYVAKGCSGDDVVTARATINGSNVQAVGTINVLPANLGSIEFVSAVPANIGLQGSGQPETSTVTFRVKNEVGGNVGGQLVTFALNTTVGGITLAPTSGTTNADGTVQTVVRAGTVATTVRVTATATQASTGTTVSSQSEQLTITTGLPDQNSFSLSAETLNAEGLSRDGTQVAITIRAADRFNNPVPNGTAVNFRTEGGDIQGSCLTVGGACSVIWESQDPRPDAVGASPAGRSTIFAYALGEESFIDADGDGLYDSTEIYGDLPEAFRDDSENGNREASEEFIDIDTDGAYDVADTAFNGLLCDAGGGTPVQCSPQRTTVNVRASLVMVMSGSSAVINPASDVSVTGTGVTYDAGTRTITVPDAGSFGISVVIRDANDQPMASGTTVKFEVTGGGSLLGDSDYVVPSTNDDSAVGNTYPTTYEAPDLEAGDANDTALLQLNVTSPESGLVTPTQFTIITIAPPPPPPP